MQQENWRRDACPHDVYHRGLCGNCGALLDPSQSTSVSMIHSVPELKVSEQYAKEIGKADQERLIGERKLVLLVDLDQTILHTTHEKVREQPNVHSFVLWPGQPTYYTKLRPHLKEFLEQMSKIYELHIFTFGCRLYAHKIASIIDPDKRYFGTRILSRDESVDQYSKRGNLSNLFPCGDAMVCIIDDRADVWRDAGNLIQVKPYSYFKTSISDGALMSNNQAADDDGSLDDEVDELEALLGLEDDTNADDDRGQDEEVPEGRRKKKRRADSATGDKGDEQSKEKKPAEPANDRVGEPAISADKTEQRHSEKVGQGSAAAATAAAIQIQETEADEGKPEDSQTSDSRDRVNENKGEPKDSVPKQDVDLRWQPSPIEDDKDDHLAHLPSILGRIHEKWYMELDEQRQFLVDGENYKLPDIKDIIRRYLRKKYN